MVLRGRPWLPGFYAGLVEDRCARHKVRQCETKDVFHRTRSLPYAARARHARLTARTQTKHRVRSLSPSDWIAATAHTPTALRVRPVYLQGAPRGQP